MDFEVVIVGGGPAGASTALHLLAARPELSGRVAIVERGVFPREKICAGAIGGRAERALAAIGVRADVPGVLVRGLSVSSGAGLRVGRRKDPIGRVVRRLEFDAALVERAIARGARLIEDTGFLGLVVSRDHVAVATTRGELRASVLVGADGVGSAVRRALGVGGNALQAQAVEVDTPPLEGEAEDVLAFDLTSPSLCGYAWDFPTIVGGERLVCRGIYALRMERGPGAARGPDVSALLEERLERLGLSHAAPRRRFRRFAERGLPLHTALGARRVLLVGEAAGIDPALGEGIAQAILYGGVGAGYLARRLEEGELSFSDWPRALASTRLGRDLHVRTRAAPWLYGPGRAVAERWLARSEALVEVGMRYFAGEPVPRRGMGRALADLAMSAWPGRPL